MPDTSTFVALRTRFLFVAATAAYRIGVVSLAAAAVFALSSWWVTRDLLRSSATVTENVATQDAKGNVLYIAHLRFRDTEGATVSLIDTVTSMDGDSPDLATGAVVPVLYPSGHPENARIATVWRHYRIAIILGILGVVLVDTGLVTRLILKRRNA